MKNSSEIVRNLLNLLTKLGLHPFIERPTWQRIYEYVARLQTWLITIEKRK